MSITYKIDGQIWAHPKLKEPNWRIDWDVNLKQFIFTPLRKIPNPTDWRGAYGYCIWGFYYFDKREQIYLTKFFEEQGLMLEKVFKHAMFKTKDELDGYLLEIEKFMSGEWRVEEEKVPTKHDEKKAPLAYLPFEAIEEVSKVFKYGADKYGNKNYLEKTGFQYSRLLSSLLRHLFAWARKEDFDPESGLSHLAHAACNVLMLLTYTLNKHKYNLDDR